MRGFVTEPCSTAASTSQATLPHRPGPAPRPEPRREHVNALSESLVGLRVGQHRRPRQLLGTVPAARMAVQEFSWYMARSSTTSLVMTVRSPLQRAGSSGWSRVRRRLRSRRATSERRSPKRMPLALPIAPRISAAVVPPRKGSCGLTGAATSDHREAPARLTRTTAKGACPASARHARQSAEERPMGPDGATSRGTARTKDAAARPSDAGPGRCRSRGGRGSHDGRGAVPAALKPPARQRQPTPPRRAPTSPAWPRRDDRTHRGARFDGSPPQTGLPEICRVLALTVAPAFCVRSRLPPDRHVQQSLLAVSGGG
jgi:hypothetical protein